MATGLVPLVDAIVTSAELGTRSKVTMVHRARDLLGLQPGLTTTVLIDDKAAHVDEFAAAGGHCRHFVRDRFPDEATEMLGSLVA